MSYIIDDAEGLFFREGDQSGEDQLRTKLEEKGKNEGVFSEEEDSKVGTPQLGTGFVLNSYSEETSLRRPIFTIFPLLHVVLNLVLKPVRNTYSLKLELCAGQSSYLRVPTHSRRILVCKQFSKRSHQRLFTRFKISLNLNNGKIKIQTPQYTSQSILSILSTSCSSVLLKNLKNLKLEIKKELKQLNDPLRYVVGLSFIQQERMGIWGSRQIDPKQQRLYTYARMATVNTNLDESETKTQQRMIIKNSINQRKSIEELLSRLQSFNQVSFKSLDLYQQCHKRSHQKSSQKDFQLTCFQREQIKQKIKTPSLPKPKNPNQNVFILNHAKLKEPQKINLVKINSGGFSTIYAAQMELCYLSSDGFSDILLRQDIQNLSKTTWLRKMIVVKREDKHKHEKSRVEHQKMILMKIKNGQCMFLPKYYITNDPACPFKNDLLTDYINYPNLGEYVAKNRFTLSLQTKIHLMYVIVQALRYIKNYKIVHLDLKPSNIMIHKALIIKLIDFGQSYHPQVCGKNHMPGFSIPYSSPENYYKPESFSEKTDVFSVGVIFYELLLDRFPFFFQSEGSCDRGYRYCEFMNYWFYNPEQIMKFGDNKVFPILNLLIGRCMHANPQYRPELDWIVLILKQSLDYFY